MSDLSEILQTPMMRQYMEIKAQFPESILFFRMGDFYEMFLEDAKIASQILDITLTKRQNQIPMAGIPYHSADSYIPKLLQAGKKIVICEQAKSDDPKAKLMQREVVRVITPGTVIEEHLLSSFENNYISILWEEPASCYLGFADVSTSEFVYFTCPKEDRRTIEDTLHRFSPKELITFENENSKLNLDSLPYLITKLDSSYKPDSSKKGSDVLVHILDCYLKYNYRHIEFEFKNIRYLDQKKYLQLDETTIENLELVYNRFDSKRTLFGILNKCSTSAGKRALRNHILFPDNSKQEIESHWDKLKILLQNKKERIEIRQILTDFSDLERILARFKGGKGLPRDFKALQSSLTAYELLESILRSLGYRFLPIYPKLKDFQSAVISRIHPTEVPAILGNSPFLQQGFSSDYDKAVDAKTQGKDWILKLESEERAKTGLSTLKIRYNKILGYYIEVSRNQAKDTPAHYQKKQTLVTSERYTSTELEDLERIILQADETIEQIELKEFSFLIDLALQSFSEFTTLSQEIADLDYHLSLAICSEEYNWKKPEIHDNGFLSIEEGRHPVVEAHLPFGERFISNSLQLDPKSDAIAILTGPNMAGKSTFMRQIALQQILFQMGSYIPAKSANLSLVDRIFTRIGSGDNITEGQSTFFVEMKETAEILRFCTSDSLILFDEVGRGTSTYDGLSLAWAILEFVADFFPRPKTIFATHYHELTDLDQIPGIFNLYLDTFEKEGEILFLKKVRKGKSKKSFGIYVAKIAGIPKSVIERASQILKNLEAKKKEVKFVKEEPNLFSSLSFQNSKEIENDSKEKADKERFNSIVFELNNLDLNHLTPMDALQKLNDLKRKLIVEEKE